MGLREVFWKEGKGRIKRSVTLYLGRMAEEAGEGVEISTYGSQDFMALPPRTFHLLFFTVLHPQFF